MLTETELKSKLQGLAKNGFRPDGNEDVSLLIPDMLCHIGSTDSILRDNLIYSAFGNWILERKAFSPQQMHDLAENAISSEHIFYKIGEVETDSVFRRTFSLLLLPLLLISHRSNPFLSKTEVMKIKDKLLRYLLEEKDLRGFVENKGWAHAIAHCADALDDVTQCEELGKSDLLEILKAISPVICQYETAYTYGEEERLCTAVLAILRRNLLSVTKLSQWIQGFVDAERAVQSFPEKMIIRSNIKDFLQSLHFRVRWEYKEHRILDCIDQALYTLSPYTKKEGN